MQRSGQGPGDGEKHKKRRREDLEWLYVRMNSMDPSSKKLLRDYGLQLARDPQTGTFKTGMHTYEKALRVQYSPAEGPASATLVLPLHIRSEAPRKGRTKADDASQQLDYVLQRFYLSEWPPGVSLDGREVYRYSVEPADPLSQAEGAQLPKLIIRGGSCGNKDACDGGKQAHEGISRPQPVPNTASESAAPGAQVLPLHIRSEAPRRVGTRNGEAGQQPEYVVQRSYLSELPPGTSMDGRDTYRYFVEPADPSTLAEDAQLPKLVIQDPATGQLEGPATGQLEDPIIASKLEGQVATSSPQHTCQGHREGSSWK